MLACTRGTGPNKQMRGAGIDLVITDFRDVRPPSGVHDLVDLVQPTRDWLDNDVALNLSRAL